MNRLRNKVRAIRRQKKITIADLAKRVGVSESMLYQIEREEKKPSLILAQRIARVLEVSVEELFFEPYCTHCANDESATARESA